MTRYLRERTLFGPLIDTPPSEDLGLCVVIPARNESESLIPSLNSLAQCDPTNGSVEIIVVINTSEMDSEATVQANRESAAAARRWAEDFQTAKRTFHLIECHGLPKKHAGVGLARKIGMDESCRRLESMNRPDGVIACFDADSTCDPNYLATLEAHFAAVPNCQAASLYFEHPLSGDGHSQAIYDAIAAYELHLRYYINAQRFAGFPFAIQTIGSSMAVRADAYQAQNGMNRRQAGEDFYFLHKFTPLGHVSEINETRVIPSPRRSHRVPFGTGRAVGELLDTGAPCLTYSPRSFQDLRQGLAQILQENEISDQPLPPSLSDFLETVPFQERLEEIKANVTSPGAFRDRFFRWFNAFLVMKYLHHSRDHHHPDIEVNEAASWLYETVSGSALPSAATARERLDRWRERDRSR